MSATQNTLTRTLVKLRQVTDMLEYVIKVRGSVDGAEAEIKEARVILTRTEPNGGTT